MKIILFKIKRKIPQKLTQYSHFARKEIFEKLIVTTLKNKLTTAWLPLNVSVSVLSYNWGLSILSSSFDSLTLPLLGMAVFTDETAWPHLNMLCCSDTRSLGLLLNFLSGDITYNCDLTRPPAKHHTAVRSPFPLPLWDRGEKQENEACGLR